jgi:hypothetical protein
VSNNRNKPKQLAMHKMNIRGQCIEIRDLSLYANRNHDHEQNTECSLNEMQYHEQYDPISR